MPLCRYYSGRRVTRVQDVAYQNTVTSTAPLVLSVNVVRALLTSLSLCYKPSPAIFFPAASPQLALPPSAEAPSHDFFFRKLLFKAANLCFGRDQACDETHWCRPCLLCRLF